ncbi:MAG: hypothetical protein WCJ18_02370 [Planctomycetota bacterium]
MRSPALFVGLLALTGCDGAEKKPTASVPIQTRQTLTKTTQNVLEMSEAIKQGGVRAEMTIQSQGLGVAADAYRTSVGKLSIIAVDQKMSFFQAENDRKPKDYNEFMDRIIEKGKPDGILLPMLPYYQEYAYDPEANALVVMEFPAKKEQRQRETTGAAGL